MTKNSSLNYRLFDKYLTKLSADTIAKFGSHENVVLFLQSLCETGNIASSARSVIVASIIQLHQLIHSDKALTKCVAMALEYATKAAEGVLYDRAINGYEELTYDTDGKIIARKKKYCSKSLLEYLKANSAKYQNQIKRNDRNNHNHKQHMTNLKQRAVDLPKFEVESYDTNNSTAANKT